MSKKTLSDILLQFVWGYAIIWHNFTVLIIIVTVLFYKQINKFLSMNIICMDTCIHTFDDFSLILLYFKINVWRLFKTSFEG